MLDKALDEVLESSILVQKDIDAIRQIVPELQHNWDTVQIFRTRTEMDISVLNDLKHPTPDAKYWQCQREQNVMFTELVSMSFDYRKNSIEIKQLKKSLLNQEDLLERELIQVEIDRKTFMAASLTRTAADRIREILAWSDIKNSLIPHMKYGIEDVNTHQLSSFSIRFHNQAQLVNHNTPVADAINIIGLHESAKRQVKSIEGS